MTRRGITRHKSMRTGKHMGKWRTDDDVSGRSHGGMNDRGDDHGPMDTDAIGAAAAMEAIKQTAAAAQSSNAPAGALQAGKAGRAAQEEEEETTAARASAGGSGGLQDKLVGAVSWFLAWLMETQMALAMSHAGKLFDKKNAGASGSSGDKAQGACYFDGVCARADGLCSDAIRRCDCDAAVHAVPEQGQARVGRHVQRDWSCHEIAVKHSK